MCVDVSSKATKALHYSSLAYAQWVGLSLATVIQCPLVYSNLRYSSFAHLPCWPPMGNLILGAYQPLQAAQVPLFHTRRANGGNLWP